MLKNLSILLSSSILWIPTGIRYISYDRLISLSSWIIVHMNQLLDITGHFIYLAVSVILFPLMVVLDCFLGLWMFAKYSKKLVRRLSIRARQKQKQEVYPLDLRKALVYLRSKSMNIHVNGNWFKAIIKNVYSIDCGWKVDRLTS